MKHELHELKNVLDEHLTAINENTSEIQVLFDYLSEMENKMEKLANRLDQIQLSLNLPLPKLSVVPLNQMERKVFLTLYTEEMALTYPEIAKKSQIALSIIPECVSGLGMKGVPLVRAFCKNQLFVRMDPHFKELQAKENLVNLSLQSFIEKQ